MGLLFSNRYWQQCCDAQFQFIVQLGEVKPEMLHCSNNNAWVPARALKVTAKRGIRLSAGLEIPLFQRLLRAARQVASVESGR